MRDYDVRSALRIELETLHATDRDQPLFVDELGLFGEARVDVAVVNGSLTGYELKSARDRLDRLPHQIAAYSRVLDFAHLVVAESHLEKARPLLPAWWGLWAATGDATGIRLRRRRQARPNPGVDPAALVQLLWRDEALLLLEQRGLDAGVRSKPRDFIWARLVESFSTDDLRDSVRHALRARRGWRENPALRESGATSPLEDTTPRFLARRLPRRHR